MRRIVKHRQYISRGFTHTFALLHDSYNNEYSYRYKWGIKNGSIKGEYGEKNYYTWAFDDFDHFIKVISNDFDLQILDEEEEFITIEDMEI